MTIIIAKQMNSLESKRLSVLFSSLLLLFDIHVDFICATKLGNNIAQKIKNKKSN